MFMIFFLFGVIPQILQCHISEILVVIHLQPYPLQVPSRQKKNSQKKERKKKNNAKYNKNS